MADFCKQCSIENFNEDFEDLADLGEGMPLKENCGYLTVCEGCGPAIVDKSGTCIAVHCYKKHGVQSVS